jgi:hypothetical protein
MNAVAGKRTGPNVILWEPEKCSISNAHHFDCAQDKNFLEEGAGTESRGNHISLRADNQSDRSDGHQLLFFSFEEIFKTFDFDVGELLNLFGGTLFVVGGDKLVFGGLLD